MKERTYLLREKPKFEIILSTDSVKIIDKSISQSNESFLLDKLEKFEIKEKRTNWLITILSFVLELFMSTSPGKYSENPQLHIKYIGKSFKYYLNDCNFQLLTEIEEIIKPKNL
ncbi:hypothetical protein Musp01_01990 [Muricauda sp. NBRC 101325]|nr:hypothetical protein Musp01_01990 [Muricauda sp. NBRC 101325]